MQITDCNQLSGFNEAPATVHFAESDRIDSAVVAAPPSLTTSPAAPSAAVVVPVQFHTATPLAASAPSPTTTVSATSLRSSSPAMVTSPMKAPAATTPAVSSPSSPTTPPTLVSPMQAIIHAPTLADMVPLSLPLRAAAPIPRAGPWLFACAYSPPAQHQAFKAPSLAWSTPPAQPRSAAPIAGVAARGGHHRLHVQALHGFEPGGFDSRQIRWSSQVWHLEEEGMDRAPLQKQIPWDGVDFGEPYVFCLDYNCNIGLLEQGCHGDLLWTARSSAPAIATARGRVVLEGRSSVMASGAGPGAHTVL